MYIVKLYPKTQNILRFKKFKKFENTRTYNFNILLFKTFLGAAGGSMKVRLSVKEYTNLIKSKENYHSAQTNSNLLYSLYIGNLMAETLDISSYHYFTNYISFLRVL